MDILYLVTATNIVVVPSACRDLHSSLLRATALHPRRIRGRINTLAEGLGLDGYSVSELYTQVTDR